MRLTARALPLAALLAVALGSDARRDRSGRRADSRADTGRRSGDRPRPRPRSATPTPDVLGLPLPTPIAPTVLRIRETPSIAVERLSADNPYREDRRGAGGPSAEAHVRRRDAVRRVLRVGPRGPDRQGPRRAARARSDSLARRRVAEVVFALDVLARPPRRPAGRHVGRVPRRPRGRDPLSQDRPDGVHVRFRRRRRFRSRSTGRPTPSGSTAARSAPPADGTVPIDQVDTAPIPQKTPWSADSYKGPFTVKYWVKVDKTGKIDKRHPARGQRPGPAPLLPPLDERLGDPAGAVRRRARRVLERAHARRAGLLLGRHQADRRAQRQADRAVGSATISRRSPTRRVTFAASRYSSSGIASRRVRPNISLNSPTSSDAPARGAQARDDVVDRRLRDDPAAGQAHELALLDEIADQALDHLAWRVTAFGHVHRRRRIQASPRRKSSTIRSDSSRSGPASSLLPGQPRLLAGDRDDAPRRRAPPRSPRPSADRRRGAAAAGTCCARRRRGAARGEQRRAAASPARPASAASAASLT